MYSKTIANNNGSKTATITKQSQAYAPPPKGGPDLESLMAKFNNSLAIQNILGANATHSQFKATVGSATAKSRNTT